MSDQDEADTSVPSFARWEKFYEGYTTIELMHALAKVRKQKDADEAVLKETTSQHDYLSKVILPTRMVDENIKNMTLDGIGRIGLRSDIYASVKAGMKERSFTYLRDIGKGDLIQPTVASSTLKAVLKAMLKNGEEPPEEIYNVTAYQMATITKV